MKLLVRNLAKATTEEKLIALFQEHGSIQSCNLVLDKETGASKGFAFIEMPKAGEAKAAIKQLNGYKLAGNLIRVKKAEVKKTDEQLETTNTETKTTPKIVKKKSAEKTHPSSEMVDAEGVWGTVKE